MMKKKIAPCNLNIILKQKNITLQTLGNNTNIPLKQVSDYCHGLSEPSLDELLRISEFLEVSITEIYPNLKRRIKNSLSDNNSNGSLNNSWLSKMINMNLSSLKNQIIFITAFITGFAALIISIWGWSFVDNTSYIDNLQSSLELTLITKGILGIGLAVIFSLAFEISFLSYILAFVALKPMVFYLHFMIAGLVEDQSLKRWILRVITLILTIIWIQIAKKIQKIKYKP